MIYAGTTNMGSIILHMGYFSLPTEIFQILKPAKSKINHEVLKCGKIIFMARVDLEKEPVQE